MTVCEDCGDKVSRRKLCWHCGKLVCGWCWHHIHCCEPGHKKENCVSLKSYKRYGKEIIKRFRAYVKAKEAA